jgi:uncharacterized membrane protein YciS (DUF1049 family)
MDILLLIAITFAAGVVGGLVMAEAFDLDHEDRRRDKRRQQRRAKRQARREKNRKMPTFTIDKF